MICVAKRRRMLIEYALGRLRISVGRFVVPSPELSDVQALKNQIELRRRALRDLEIIHAHLWFSKGGGMKGLPRRRKRGGTRQPHLGRGLRNKLIILTI